MPAAALRSSGFSTVVYCRIALAVGSLLLGSAAGSVSNAQIVAPAPLAASLAVCRPVFQTTAGELAAGTAFVIQARPATATNPGTLLVTAHHLFGPDGGLARPVSWKDLPAFVQSVRCTPLEGTKNVVSAGPPLRVPEARPFSEFGLPRDVALFPVRSRASHSLPLAESIVGAGRPVWLVAQVAADGPATRLLHRAVVLNMDARRLEFAYDNGDMDLTSTSGAPIVNERGEVVGVNLAARAQDARLVGVAHSAMVVRQAVSQALRDADPSAARPDGARTLKFDDVSGVWRLDVEYVHRLWKDDSGTRYDPVEWNRIAADPDQLKPGMEVRLDRDRIAFFSNGRKDVEYPVVSVSETEDVVWIDFKHFLGGKMRIGFVRKDPYLKLVHADGTWWIFHGYRRSR